MTTDTPTTEVIAPPATKRSILPKLIIIGVLLLLFIIIMSNIGLYSVQPIGAVPEGITLVVRRLPGEPFFNSADGTCLRIQEGVSLLCRMMALTQSKLEDRIILRLPYQSWAYLLSTGGRTFER